MLDITYPGTHALPKHTGRQAEAGSAKCTAFLSARVGQREQCARRARCCSTEHRFKAERKWPTSGTPTSASPGRRSGETPADESCDPAAELAPSAG